ncbi:MAG: hypothetical protein GX638_03170 [Crenarchaeota archaeon]|nr:hypothetical protein [Thermoproteota archaeon]
MINQVRWEPIQVVSAEEREKQKQAYLESKERERIANEAAYKSCLYELLTILEKMAIEEKNLRSKLHFQSQIIDWVICDAIKHYVVFNRWLGEDHNLHYFQLNVYRKALTDPESKFYFPDIATQICVLRRQIDHYTNILIERSIEDAKIKRQPPAFSISS